MGVCVATGQVSRCDRWAGVQERTKGKGSQTSYTDVYGARLLGRLAARSVAALSYEVHTQRVVGGMGVLCVRVKASIFLEGYYDGVLRRPKIFASFS